MKRISALLFVALFGVTWSACSLIGDDGSTDLGGDTNIEMNTVGNVISTGMLTVGDDNMSLDAAVTVLANDDGLITAKVEIDLDVVRDLPGFQMIYDAIPSRYKDSEGNISSQIQFKSTSEGIVDYANMDEEPHMLVRYKDGVGTQYSLTKSSGRTLTREVVAKSNEDDFPYGFMYIKTSTIEQEMNVAGVRKIIYRANHKFGIVYAEAIMDDGSSVNTYLYSAK
jgi:hypothetical protein